MHRAIGSNKGCQHVASILHLQHVTCHPDNRLYYYFCACWLIGSILIYWMTCSFVWGCFVILLCFCCCFVVVFVLLFVLFCFLLLLFFVVFVCVVIVCCCLLLFLLLLFFWGVGGSSFLFSSPCRICVRTMSYVCWMSK